MRGVTRFQVRLSVPRVGGWRAWGAVSEEFERRLAEQDSPVIAVHVDSCPSGRSFAFLIGFRS